MKRVLAIYCRTSKRKGERDVSIVTQKEQGVKFATKMAMPYKFYIDKGVSGTLSKFDDRDGFAQLCSDIRGKTITDVWAYDQSRIERSVEIWTVFMANMVKAGCSYFPGGKEVNFEDTEDQFSRQILSVVNGYFAAMTGRKVKLNITANALQGKTHGVALYGYKKDKDGYFQIEEEEGKVVKKIFQLSLEGVGTYTIAKILNNEGISTRMSRYQGTIKRRDKYTKEVTEYKKKDIKWRGNVIHDMIINSMYMGQRTWNEHKVKVPAIIEPEHWEKVNLNLETNKKKAGKREEYQYLLNGLILCSDCGLEFRGKRRLKGNDNAYKCNGKSYYQKSCKTARGISIPKLETFIIHHLFHSKDLKAFLSEIPINNEETSNLKKKVLKLKQELKDVGSKISNGLEMLLDKGMKDDLRLIEMVNKLKKRELILKTDIDFIDKQLVDIDNNNRVQRVTNVIGRYSIGCDFATLKQLIHSLIERIEIKHHKEEKRGVFTIGIKYRGFEEKSIFTTNWDALNWHWLNRHREKAINEKDLQEDRETLKGLYKYFNVDKKLPSSFDGLETVELRHEVIKLNKDQLFQFD